MSHPGRGGLDAVDEQPNTEPVVELGVVILATFMTYLDGLVPSSEHASPHVRTCGSRLGREGTQPRGGSPRALRRSSVFWNRL